jgi:hypothetical protein
MLPQDFMKKYYQNGGGGIKVWKGDDVGRYGHGLFQTNRNYSFNVMPEEKPEVKSEEPKKSAKKNGKTIKRRKVQNNKQSTARSKEELF